MSQTPALMTLKADAVVSTPMSYGRWPIASGTPTSQARMIAVTRMATLGDIRSALAPGLSHEALGPDREKRDDHDEEHEVGLAPGKKR